MPFSLANSRTGRLLVMHVHLKSKCIEIAVRSNDTGPHNNQYM